jgi:acetyl-CoA carboxylase biotin carboxylase subunit
MFFRVLIANRGEIALRIIRACKELGVETVVVYSEADHDALYLKQADEAICIGPGPSMESYLNIARIISAAEVADVEAIHPGYGFLAENAHFAEVCQSCKIKFIGPNSEAMQLVGDKAAARKLAVENKIPVIPGSPSTVENQDEALKIAHEIGYPVIIKAAAGGGGRGMRIAHNDVSLVKSLIAAQNEAEAAFKISNVYIEKYIEEPKHIEVQILADEYGDIVHLGERDCSLQRRHQKIMEESPSPAVKDELREDMGRAAVRLARAAGYSNAGTVEFLVDKQGKFFFLEMNARIQVEHPLTEMITGMDLVKEQMRIASGEPLGLRQRHIRFQGAAIECRINAEDPDNDFKPWPGLITMYNAPGGPGVRVDTHIYTGYRISRFYDSLIAKVIIHRSTRSEALLCMRRALEEMVIEGVKTIIPLHQRILRHPRFLRAEVDTAFIENELIR